MNQAKSQQPDASELGTSSPVKTHLSGSRLVLARTLWLALVVPSLGFAAAGFPLYYQQLQRPCSGPVTCNFAGALTAHGLQAFAAIGFSASEYAAFNTLFWASTSVVWSGMGLLIFWRRSDDWFALLAAFALLIFNTTYPGLPGSSLALVYPALGLPFALMGLLGQISIGLLFLLFPNGRLVPRWVGLIIPLILLQGVSLVVPPTSPFSQNNWPGWLNGVFALSIYGTTLFSQAYRYRRASTPLQRQQTKWVAFGIIVVVAGFILYGLLFSVIFPAGNQPDSPYLLIQLVYPLTLLLIPLTIGIAILRYRLWDIDVIINRALVYGTLTVSVVGVYILVVGYLGALFRTGGNLPISLVATGLVAVLFQPLRGWLQRGVNRLMYGQRDEPYAVVARLGRRLESTLAPEAMLPAIVETVAQALKLPYAAITLNQGEAFKDTAVYGSPVEGLLTLPLSYQAEPVGQLVLGPRQRGEGFTPADRRLLDDLARQVGIAAHAVRLTSDLQRSRERLVTAREEERRRLRRDLHDGLGPTLAALALKATTVSDLIPTNPPAATELSNELYADIRATVGEIRRLVYELRPPRLDDLGLVGAIRETARQQSQPGGLQITVEAPERLPALPAAVEVAAYRIAQEALTNVVRHAQASTCTVRLTLAGALQVEVSDNGVGIPPEHHSGVGLLSMRERATELGGPCVIERNPQAGTRVCARLPIPILPQEEANGAAAPADC